MKKLLYILIPVVLFLSVAIQSYAQDGTLSNLNPWKLSGTTITTRNSASAVKVPSLATTTSNLCLTTDSTGLFTLVTCGTGGSGGGTTTTINGVNGPNFTFNIAGLNGLSYSTSTGIITLTQATSSASQSGFLSKDDWATFNGKQAAGNYITALTGDGTASGPGSAAFTLATVNSNTGTFGSSTTIPVFTVNGKGLITAVVATSTPFIRLTSLSATSPITYNSGTGVFACPTCLIFATATTTINGVNGPTFTFNVSGNNGLSYSTSTGVVTITQATSTASQSGFLSSTDWSTFNAKESAISAGTTAQYWRGDKSFQTLNQAAVAGLTTTDNVTHAGISVTNATSSGTLGVPKDKTLAIAGQVTVKTTTSTLNFHDGTAERVLNPEKCFAPSWIIENPTAAEDIPIMIFNATSTITKVKAVNKTSGDTITFNLGYGSSRATATSSLTNVFSSNQTVTATTTVSSLSLTGTLTPGTNNILRFYTTAASTSQFTLDVCYRENP
jgi:hypothetical protein